jgi:hypothetical protein
MQEIIIGEYGKEHDKRVSDKLFSIYEILVKVCEEAGNTKKLKNHSIHHYKNYLLTKVIDGGVSKKELKHLVVEVDELVKDFAKSRNILVKELSQKALKMMNELIDGNTSLQIYLD